MPDIPQIDTKTAADILALAQQRAYEVSAGRLSDFSPASPVTAILEAVAVIGTQVLQQVNSLAATLEADRLSLFGLARRGGTQAVGTILVRLDGLYAEPFSLPAGFRLQVAAVQFQTTDDLVIPPYTDSGTVGIVATTAGSFGNLSANSPVTSQSLRRLATITLTEETKNGRDEESEESFRLRVYALLRRRDTLISLNDFEAEVMDFLGLGSQGLALARLKPDRVTYANGYVGVFGLNSDGSLLTNAQMTQLSELLNRKAAMATITVWSMQTFALNVDCVVGINPATSPDSIADTIYQTLKTFLQPGNVIAGEPVLNKAIEARIQSIVGVTLGVIDVKLNGFAMPVPMPTRWTVAVLGKVAIALILDGGKGGEVTYNYA